MLSPPATITNLIHLDLLDSQIDDYNKKSNKEISTSREAAKPLESGLRLLGCQIDYFYKESNRKMTNSRETTKSFESGLKL